ncbi:MAG: hypothetical protein FJW30_28080 [Acidobacteria bacterium]|nr:hypothetical protein [Acidobacteriota bacterium]
MRRWWKRLITYPLLAVAAVLLLVEEALWRLAKVYALLGKLPVFRSLETWIAGLPPYGALALFGVPSIALAPIKLLAFYWLAGGHPVLGVSTIFTAKILGTAFVARLFQLTQPKLLAIGWFAWVYRHVTGVRKAAYDLWRFSAAGRLFFRFREAWKRRRGWFNKRWSAIRQKLSVER